MASTTHLKLQLTPTFWALQNLDLITGNFAETY